MRQPVQPVLTWEADLPLFSRRFLSQWTLGLGVTALIMAGLLGTIFAAAGEWESLVPMLALVAGVCTGIWLLGFVIMAVLFRGRYRVRYQLSEEGLTCETIDRVARAANRAAVVTGLLGGRSNVAGAGLIGMSREREEVRWTGAFRAVYEPDRACVLLRNRWRTLMWVQCAAENYAAVAAAIDDRITRHGTATRATGPSPLPRYLARTALVVAASIPLFLLADEYDTSMLVPILVLCFALATVWLVNLLAWVVLAGVVLQAALLALRLMEVRASFFDPGTTYRAYQVVGSDDLTLFAVAGAGAAVLVWLSIRALRLRWLPALMDGARDMEGA